MSRGGLGGRGHLRPCEQVTLLSPYSRINVPETGVGVTWNTEACYLTPACPSLAQDLGPPEYCFRMMYCYIT